MCMQRPGDDLVYYDLLLYNVLMENITADLDVMEVMCLDLMDQLNREEQRLGRAPPTLKSRRSWSVISNKFSDSIFRRMFRMTKESFGKLSSILIEGVGEDTFMSESFLLSRPEKRTENASETHGGVIPGELKLAMTLRMLAGSSYLDLLDTYDVNVSSVYNAFHSCIGWIEESMKFPLIEMLRSKDENGLNVISRGFAAFNRGLLDGIIGVIDGLAIKIRCPSPDRDCVEDIGNWYSRKGFYALNVQAICDSDKRFLWVSPMHKGTTHDSSAWYETGLHTLCKELRGWLAQKGYVIIGDSAYNLLEYFLIPFAVAPSGSAEDAFNFWLSNSRIRIECAFGELIMRWGIFWRTLRFDLKQCSHIVKAAMLLHNFLVDERELNGTKDEEAAFFRNFSSSNVTEQRNRSPEPAEPLVTDCDALRPVGRLDKEEVESKMKGELRRTSWMTDLRIAGMVRMLPEDKVAHNQFGHVYMKY